MIHTMNQLENKKRSVAADLFKFVAIFFVVLTHVLQYLRVSDDLFSSFYYNFIWLFQMPAFFIVSGYFSKLQVENITKKSMALKILKRAFNYIVPFFMWLILSCVIYKQSILSSFLSSIIDPTEQLWFLSTIFIMVLVSYFIQFLFKNKKIIFSLVCFFVIFIFFYILCFILKNGKMNNIFGIKQLAFYFPFFILGLLCNYFKFKSKLEKVDPIHSSLIFIIVLFFIFLLIKIFKNGIYYFDDTSILHLLVRYSGGIASSFCVYYLCHLVSKFKAAIHLSKLGKYTLEIYFFHLLVIKLFYINLSNYSNFVFYSICLGIALGLIAVSIIAQAILYFIPFGKAIIFGKSNSCYNFEKNFFYKINCKKNPKAKQSIN